MKKLTVVVAALVIAGMTSSWAQSNIINTTSNEVAGFVFGPVPISFTGKLSNKGSVDAAALAATAPGGGTLEFAEGYEVGPLSTGQVGMAIGTSLGTSNVTSGVNSGAVVLVGYKILTSFDFVDLSKAGSKSAKSLSGWTEDGEGRVPGGSSTNFLPSVQKVVSNAALLVSATITDPKSAGKSTTNVTAKVTGVWQDGATTITGTIGKPKK
jgi:uncharacterized membrane protein